MGDAGACLVSGSICSLIIVLVAASLVRSDSSLLLKREISCMRTFMSDRSVSVRMLSIILGVRMATSRSLTLSEPVVMASRSVRVLATMMEEISGTLALLE